MSIEEFKKLINDNKISQNVIESYLMEKGYIVLTHSEYDNLEVIDPNGDVP